MQPAIPQSNDCPQISSCPLGPIAIDMIKTMDRLEGAVENLLGVVKRVDSLESTRNQQIGSNDARKSMRRFVLIVAMGLLALGGGVWSTLHNETRGMQASVAAARNETVYASEKADDLQERLATATQKAEAAAIERANLAAAAKQNTARIRAMRAAVANNSAEIAALPPPAVLPATPAIKKRWYQK